MSDWNGDCDIGHSTQRNPYASIWVVNICMVPAEGAFIVARSYPERIPDHSVSACRASLILTASCTLFHGPESPPTLHLRDEYRLQAPCA